MFSSMSKPTAYCYNNGMTYKSCHLRLIERGKRKDSFLPVWKPANIAKFKLIINNSNFLNHFYFSQITLNLVKDVNKKCQIIIINKDGKKPEHFRATSLVR